MNSKIALLSIAVLLLATITLGLGNNLSQGKTLDVSIFVEGDNAGLTRVADLLVEYDKNNLELVSATGGGFLVGSSTVQKDGWEDGRSLLMSTTIDTTKPILELKFRSKKTIEPSSVKLSPESTIYLTGIGASTIVNNEGANSEVLSYRVSYE